MICTASMKAMLNFNQLEDGDDIGFPDETPLENAEVLASDYMLPTPLPQGQVKRLFETLKLQGDAVRKMQLDYRSLDQAVPGIIHTLGMEACDKSEVPVPGKNAHELWLSGTFAGGVSVVARALLGMDGQGRLLMQLSVASKKKEVAERVTRFIAG